MERQIADSEREYQRLNVVCENKEKELEDLENELILEERETMKLGNNIKVKRIEIRENRSKRNRQSDILDKEKARVEELKKRQAEVESNSATEEQRLRVIEKLLDEQERARDSLKWDIEKQREKNLKLENNICAMKKEVQIMDSEIKGMAIQESGLRASIKKLKDSIRKKEDISVTCDHRIAELERQVNIIKGKELPNNYTELREEKEALKKLLEERLVEKRNLDHMVHKIQAEVRKQERELKNITTERANLKALLEEAELVCSTSKRQEEKLNQSLEALVLEEKLLMVNEKRLKEELAAAKETNMEIQKASLEIEENYKEQV